MSINIPLYSNPCLAPSSINSTIYLIGVSETVPGRLEVNTINLTNPLSPQISLTTVNSNPGRWTNTAPKICTSYPGYNPNPKGTTALPPIHIQQFGVGWSNDANIYLNSGKVDLASSFETIAFTNPKLFATVGNAGLNSFVLAMTNDTTSGTGSLWVGMRYNATDSFSSLYDFNLQNFPTATPFLAVGSYTATAKVPGRGNAIVFDSTRSGMIYAATAYDAPETDVDGNTVLLSTPQFVSMKNVALTTDAIPISSGSGAYILDKAADSSTVMYYINPSQSTILQQVIFSGNAPKFTPSMVATATHSQIVIYSIQAGVPKFNVFDMTTKLWTGPDLVTPGNPLTPDNVPPTPGNGGSINGGNDTTKAPLGAIIGGVVGGLVLIALAAFLFIRHRRRRLGGRSSSSLSSKDNGKTEMSSAPASSGSEGLKKFAITIDAPYPPPAPVSCPSTPKSIPREPQLSPTEVYYPPPPPSQNSSMRRNPQSPLAKSLAFEFAPKPPPGPELHYSDDSFGGAGLDISNPITAVESRASYSDDYSKRPYTPPPPPTDASSYQNTPVGSPQLHHLQQHHQGYSSSPLVSGVTQTYSDMSGDTIGQDFVPPPPPPPPSGFATPRPPPSLGP
ncbi:hypothetical protein BGX23_000769 [Mortierella sp. AD031]|nr:hypothetical protein BGX23_000769 [Mortierella sp. AD031]